MSWWVYLQDHGQKPWCSFGDDGPDACPEPCYPNVEIDSFQDGGTQAIGGSNVAELNITYNYGKFYYQFLDGEIGLRWLMGKSGKEALPRLILAVDQLGAVRDKDYWAATAGNAGATLALLAQWAKAYPEAIFRVS